MILSIHPGISYNILEWRKIFYCRNEISRAMSAFKKSHST